MLELKALRAKLCSDIRGINILLIFGSGIRYENTLTDPLQIASEGSLDIRKLVIVKTSAKGIRRAIWGSIGRRRHDDITAPKESEHIDKSINMRDLVLVAM